MDMLEFPDSDGRVIIDPHGKVRRGPVTRKSLKNGANHE
jgi:hypothetical protein